MNNKLERLEELQANYANVCAREKDILTTKAAIKAEIESLAPTTPEEVISWNEVEGKSPYGNFRMVSQKRWSYSPAVDRLAEDLKILKIEEEEAGTATYSESFNLRFVAKKED